MTSNKIQLVKFDTPTLVSFRQKGTSIGPSKTSQLPILRNPSIGLTLTRSPLANPQQLMIAPTAFCVRNRDELNLFKKRELEEVLNLILPPREFEQNGQKWTQKVSTTVATKRDVVHLRENLDRALVEYEASEIGICPIRTEIFKQCFDEIIRQVTVICMERGILLYNVKQEIYMCFRTYENIFKSGIGYGFRKAFAAEELQKSAKNENSDMMTEEKALEIEVDRLEAELQDLESELRRQEEELEVKRREEIDAQKSANKQLKNQIEAKIMQRRFVKKD